MNNYMSCIRKVDDSENKLKIKLHVVSGSFKPIFPAGYNKWRESLEIRVKSKAIENKANDEVIEKISSFFQIPPKNISIVSGKKSKDKVVLLKNLNFSSAYKKLEDFLK